MPSTQSEKTGRAAYSPAEFAAAFGKHATWAYRLLYAGKINAITEFGRILIPYSERDRILSGAQPYNPKHNQEVETAGAVAA
jgi:hypothetical protein